MLHGHIEALFEHWVVVIDVGPRSDYFGSSCLWSVTIVAFILEALLTGIEHHSIFEMLITRLAISFGSCFASCCLSFRILTRARYFELKALPIEYLVIVEPRWSCIKPYPFASKCLIVSSPHLSCPLRALIQIWENSTSTASSGTSST